MSRIPSPGDNVIDSRDIIARMEELQSERETLADELESAIECVKFHHNGELNPDGTDSEHEEFRRCMDELAEWDEENSEELQMLQECNDEGSCYGDWEHGEAMIHEDYFTDYCQELVSDIGDMPREIPAYIVIDWEATADNIKQDYSSIEFGGETYYIRA